MVKTVTELISKNDYFFWIKSAMKQKHKEINKVRDTGPDELFFVRSTNWFDFKNENHIHNKS